MAKIEHDVPLSASDVSEALKAKAYEVARRAGVAPDPSVFYGRAVVHLETTAKIDGDGTAATSVPSLTAHVTWED